MQPTTEQSTQTSGQEQRFKWIEYEQERAKRYNATPGDLQGFDCQECMNRGKFLAVNDDGYSTIRFCKCIKMRKNLKRMQNSGAIELIERCTLDNFIITQEWQKEPKAKAGKYIKEQSTNWFFIGGQTGAGKTHICTAILKSYFERGSAGLYIMWRPEARKLTHASFSQANEVGERLDKLSSIPVLYIDDLFKTDTDTSARPERREIELAFEIINTRYNRNLTTIISSEFMMPELAGISQAIAGRIVEKCSREYVIDIAPEKGRNYRLAGLRKQRRIF